MVPSPEMKKNQKIREFTVRSCFLVTSERSYIVMSHQYDSPNVRQTRMTPVNMSNQMRKAHGSLIYTKSNRQLKKTGIRTGGLPQGRVYQLAECQMVIPENIHSRSIVRSQQIIFRNICIYIPITYTTIHIYGIHTCIYACTHMHAITINE